jgi:hypothetical protein
MTSTEVAARYRGFAAECWSLAQHLHSDSDKRALIELASSWLDLADWVDKNDALFALGDG